jgi:hypothetical protein
MINFTFYRQWIIYTPRKKVNGVVCYIVRTISQKDKELFRKWISNINNPALYNLTIEQVYNSSLFNEFVCNLDFFWHEWASLKLE